MARSLEIYEDMNVILETLPDVHRRTFRSAIFHLYIGESAFSGDVALKLETVRVLLKDSVWYALLPLVVTRAGNPGNAYIVHKWLEDHK